MAVNFTEEVRTLTKHYLDPEEFLKAIKAANPDERYWVYELLVTEGIPFAFSKSPIIYEYVRAFLSIALSINSKDVIVVGSARTGFSLSPYKFGKSFREDKSDLDLTIINSSLFESLKNDYFQWKNSYSKNEVYPKNETEKKYWDENISLGVNNIRRGFISSNLCPRLDICSSFKLLGNSCYILGKKLQSISGAPRFKSINARIYKNWESMFNQAKLNLNVLVDKNENR